MLKGSLTTTSLAEVLRLLCASAQSGQLRLSGTDYEAGISIQHGRILHAFSGEEGGLEALRIICSRLDATFLFQSGVDSPGRTLEDYPSSSIIESIKGVVDTERQVAQAMPQNDDRPRFQTGEVGAMDASPEELQVLLGADGSRTVLELAEMTGFPLDFVAHTIARHRVSGMVTIDPAARVQPSAIAPAAPSTPPTESVEQPARYWRGKRVN